MTVFEVEPALSNTNRAADVGPVTTSFSTFVPQMSLKGASYALAILCVVTLLSQLDRNLTPLIITPLKAEFGISDTQFGLLHGYGFALTYALFGIPFGRLVDRSNRRNIILIGLAAWSALTALSGFATSYEQLFVLRIGVGIGEAVLAPAAYSLLVDYFEPGKRGRAVSVYYMSMSVGYGGSLFLGALLLRLLPPVGLNLPGMMALDPWRLLFLCAGLPGFVACMLVFTLKEPERRGAVKGDRVSIRDFLAYLWTHKALLGRISIASTLVPTATYGVTAWMPALLERQFGLAPASTGVPLGIVLILGSIGGTLLSGTLSDRLRKRLIPDARTRPMLLGYIILLPSAFIGLVAHPWVAILLFCAVPFSVAVVQSAMPLALQEAVPANMRGQVIAVQLLIQGLCSIGLGPFLVGMVADIFFHSDKMLGLALFVTILPISLFGIAFCLFGLNARTYQLKAGPTSR